MNKFFLNNNIPLPEDILRCKQNGDYEHARELCTLWLSRPITEHQKQRLAVEKRVLGSLPALYPLNETQAMRQLAVHIPGMNQSRFNKLVADGYIDWIYVSGERRFRTDLLSALRSADSPYTERSPEDRRLFDLLNDTIATLKRDGSVSHKITVKTSLTVTAPLPAQTPLRVHLPFALPTDTVSDIQLVRASENLVYIAGEDAPQRTLYFESTSSGTREFFAVYSFICKSTYHRLEPAMAQNGITCSEDVSAQPPHISDSQLIRSLCDEIVGAETNPLKKARRIYDYITRCVNYAFMRPYFTVDCLAEYVASNLKGDCGAQSLLFISLCRCANIPARWESGCFVTPYGVSMHDWARFYVEPYGWLFADCSFGGTAYRLGDRVRTDFYFGNTDCFRLPTCTGFQQEFDPAKNFWRYDPTDNQLGEAETDRRPLFPADYHTAFDVVAFE